MSWFDEGTGRPLRAVLAEAIGAGGDGVVDVVGRDGDGQVFHSDGRVVFVSIAGQPTLRSVLTLSGASTAEDLEDLARSARGSAPRSEAPAAVRAVVRDLSEAALARLLRITAGSARSEPGVAPPLGVLMSVPLDDLIETAEVREVRAAAARIAAGTAWQPTASGPVTLSAEEWRLVAVTCGHPPVEDAVSGPSPEAVSRVLSQLAERGVLRRVRPREVPPPVRTPAGPPATTSVLVPAPARTSALRRLIGAVRAG